MLTILQRVSEAHVDINHQRVAAINHGLVILCGFEAHDTSETLHKMLDKCLHYRIFSDAHGKMNLSLQNVNGGLLLVPQFTLLATTNKGLRPSFSCGASPEKGHQLFEDLVALAHKKHPLVASGQFGEHMHVHLCNDGPVTFILKF